jgi:hypothetical protein
VPDERSAALAWADAARARRETLAAQLRSGEWDLTRVLGAAHDEPLVGRVRLLYVLESLPGARKTDTRRTLAALGLDPGLPVAALDAVQRDLVLATFPLERAA